MTLAVAIAGKYHDYEFKESRKIHKTSESENVHAIKDFDDFLHEHKGASINLSANKKRLIHKYQNIQNHSHSHYARDVMSRSVKYVNPGQSLDEAIALMQNFKISHLPVVDEAMIVGIVSSKDFMGVDANSIVSEIMQKYASEGK